MANIILLVHLILAVFLIGVVLLQRSDGGALGIGGGGGLSTGRPPASPLQKVTWTLAAAFIATSLGLTTIATRMGDGGSVIDAETPAAAIDAAPADDAAPAGGSLLPPSLADGPLTPPTGAVTPPPVQLPDQSAVEPAATEPAATEAAPAPAEEQTPAEATEAPSEAPAAPTSTQ